MATIANTVNKKWLAVDLFSGSGAVTTGLKQEGFEVVAAIDSDQVACKTYSLNHPEVKLLTEDITKSNPMDVHAVLDGRVLDLLVVCAPCQPFSSQNRKRAESDPRVELIFECVKFAKLLNPTVIFFENVPGIVNAGLLDLLEGQLKKFGYKLSAPLKIDAATLGVPQRRERCILIASKSNGVVESFGLALRPVKPKTVRDAIGFLPSLCSGEESLDPLHKARKHHSITLERLKHIPKDGGSRSSLPTHLQLSCHKNKKNDFPDVYGRMRWSDVAPTLTTGCTDLTRGRFVHPEDDRALSLREASLLQTFPRDYIFYGNSGQVARQIGNAVPVEMARHLAAHLKDLTTTHVLN
ncbi:DNA cytosine methyltransferase [Pseudomonas umsongensis]|uniref:DNA cytosine methyltransferase n=1 Tax=Pseudomonas umsongensis TaxID=198618 RepID=UPI003ED0D3A0